MSFLEQAKAGLGKAGGFIFGAGTETPTYESLKKRREVAELLAQQAVGATPQNFGEGIASVGRALAYKLMDKRLAPQEAEMGEQSRGRLMEIAGLLGGGGGAPSLGGYSGQPPAMPQGDMANTIRQGLIERGLPPHVADGFVLNAQDESGLNPGINEISPTVPGSRGGFGLMQWTGPRREGLEQFAAKDGRAIDDANLQIDYLMAELGGPESKAAQAIMSTKDAGSAAATIASEFLRPAPEHLARRVAEYTGGAMPSYGGGGGIGFDPALMSELADLAGNEYLKPGERMVAQALIQRMMDQPEGISPYQQAQLGFDAERLALDRARFEREGQPKPTGLQNEYEQAVNQGFQGTIVDYQLALKKAGASNQTVTMVGEGEYDKARGKFLADSLNAIETDEKAARSANSALAAAEEAMSQPGFYSGSGGQAVLIAKRAAQAMGLDPEGVDSAEAFNALASRAVLDSIGGSLGAQVSNSDREFIERQAINLGNSPEGNRAIITIQRRLNDRKIEVAKMAREYERKNGRLDAGFNDELAAWAEQNPLFSESDPIFGGGAAQAAPGAMPDWLLQSDVTTWTDEQMLEAERLWGLQK